MARKATPQSLLVLSVDVELNRVVSRDVDPPDRISLTAHQSGLDSLQKLLGLFQQARLPAAWGFSDPASNRFVTDLVAEPEMHEVVLLGDTSWISRDAGRKGFCQHLVRRVSTAHQAGCELSTLAIYDGELTSDYDLLAKHQISMVRYPRRKRRSKAHSQRHRSLRYGLWEAPSAVRVSPRTPVLAWQPNRVVKRVIRRTIRYGGVGHLVLDLTAGQYRTSRGMNFVAQVLKTVVRYQRLGHLQVCTLRDLAAQWRPRQHVVKSGSLLRVAA